MIISVMLAECESLKVIIPGIRYIDPESLKKTIGQRIRQAGIAYIFYKRYLNNYMSHHALSQSKEKVRYIYTLF